MNFAGRRKNLPSHLTEHFTFIELWNKSINEFYVVQKRRGSRIVKCPVGQLSFSSLSSFSPRAVGSLRLWLSEEVATRLDFQTTLVTKERKKQVQQRIKIGTASKKIFSEFRNLVGWLADSLDDLEKSRILKIASANVGWDATAQLLALCFWRQVESYLKHEASFFLVLIPIRDETSSFYIIISVVFYKVNPEISPRKNK